MKVPRRLRQLGVILCILRAIPVAATDEVAEAQRLIVLLRGIEQEYREAFDAGGALARPMELREAALLLDEVRQRAPMISDDSGEVPGQVAALVDAVAARAPVDVVVSRARELSQTLRDTTGVAGELMPPQRPSAARGATLFREHCVSCHGESGAGDGPDAATLAVSPADFTDPLFMRTETPSDFFLVISLGRRGAAMPAWEDVLSPQDRWDLVSYVWSLRGGAADVGQGARLYDTHCTRCHAQDSGSGPSSADRSGGSLASLERMGSLSDSELYAMIAEGVAGSEMAGLDASDLERRQIVNFTRSLSLGDFAPVDPRTAPDPATRLDRAVTRVAQQVVAAVNAYRMRESDAAALAAAAYLDFEPLEPGIAANDPASVHRVEAEFARLQLALRRNDAAREVDEIAASLSRALDAARAATRSSGRVGWAWIAAGIAICAIAALGMLFRHRRTEPR